LIFITLAFSAARRISALFDMLHLDVILLHACLFYAWALLVSVAFGADVSVALCREHLPEGFLIISGSLQHANRTN
jgi:hypothetical protein